MEKTLNHLGIPSEIEDEDRRDVKRGAHHCDRKRSGSQLVRWEVLRHLCSLLLLGKRRDVGHHVAHVLVAHQYHCHRTHHDAGRISGVRAAYAALEVVDLLDFGYIQTLKAVLSARLGVDCGSPRLPTPPLSSEQNKALLSRVDSLGLSKVSVT